MWYKWGLRCIAYSYSWGITHCGRVSKIFLNCSDVNVLYCKITYRLGSMLNYTCFFLSVKLKTPMNLFCWLPFTSICVYLSLYLCMADGIWCVVLCETANSPCFGSFLYVWDMEGRFYSAGVGQWYHMASVLGWIPHASPYLSAHDPFSSWLFQKLTDVKNNSIGPNNSNATTKIRHSKAA